jgi:hypothetical protein
MITEDKCFIGGQSSKPAGPFGCYKQFGISREFGPEELPASISCIPPMCHPKSIRNSVPFGMAGKDRQYKRSCH